MFLKKEKNGSFVLQKAELTKVFLKAPLIELFFITIITVGCVEDARFCFRNRMEVEHLLVYYQEKF